MSRVLTVIRVQCDKEGCRTEVKELPILKETDKTATVPRHEITGYHLRFSKEKDLHYVNKEEYINHVKYWYAFIEEDSDLTRNEVIDMLRELKDIETEERREVLSRWI